CASRKRCDLMESRRGARPPAREEAEMNSNLVIDAAGRQTEAVRGTRADGANTADVHVRIRRQAVVVTLTGRIADKAELVWDLFQHEFTEAGWGWRASYGNGFDAPRTVMAFDHPITLTRIG